MQPLIDDEWKALSLHVGSGRQHPELEVTLSLTKAIDHDLTWHNQQGSEIVHCRSSQWLTWLTPIAPAESLDNYPVELLPALNEWGFRQLDEFFKNYRVNIGSPVLGPVADTYCYTLTLRDDDRCLELGLEGWSLNALLELTKDWVLTDNVSGAVNQLILPLAIGQTVLTYTELQKLCVGDGILLHQHTDIKANRIWLYQQQPWIEIMISDDDFIEVLSSSIEPEINTESSDQILNKAGLNDIPLTVVAEIGQITLRLEELASLEVGQLLQGKTRLNGEIKLTVNGCCIGYGSLIENSDRWLVRVDSVLGKPNDLTQEPQSSITELDEDSL